MIFGTQYYRPPFPDRRYWQEDLDKIKEFGLDTVQLWVIWGWVEPEPGVFVFDDYDELMEEIQKRGLNVVLSTIAEIHPYWIHRVIPDSYMVNHLGHKVISSNRSEVNNGLTPGGCFDHPEVLQRMARFLEEVATRYKDFDNLVAWDCWNEMRWSVNSTGIVCYCPHTLRKFREWLKDKYGGLDGLNRAWKRRYCSFEDVLPGTSPTWKPFTEIMEFESFLQWRIAKHTQFRYQTIRNIDKRHVIGAHDAWPCTHVVGRQMSPAMWTGNHWDVADQLDAFGTSLFPENSHEPFSEEEFGIRVEILRSAAGSKVPWVSELSGWARDANKQQRWVWNAYARGVKAVIFWCWRQEVFGMEARRAGSAGGGGISGLNGLKERRTSFQGTAKILRENAKLLDEYKPDRAEVGVYFDPNLYNMEWADKASAAAARDSLMGYLTALERLNVPYDVVESSHMDRITGLKLLIMPRPEIIGKAATEAVKAFVRNGGTVLIEAEAGSFTSTGFYNYSGPDRDLAFALGIEDLQRRFIDDEVFEVRIGDERYALKADWYFTPLKTSVNGIVGTVLSTNSAGDVVATLAQVGRGRVVSIGTFLGAKYLADTYEDFERFVRALVRLADACPQMVASSGKRVYLRTGVFGSSRLVFLISPEGPQPVTVKGTVRSLGEYRSARLLGCDCTGKGNGADIPLETVNGRCIGLADSQEAMYRQFEVPIGECGYTVLELRK
ncbi:MAG TPA: beta-galactosidase [Bacillota bacterium]|mgnify:CR=1 FL=1|nr:cellulase family glycosylhydrolase [Bacillota bacterium]HOB92394.1 beta-galactosidase [Bacillota bacterium]HPZ55549.1 beta-galactosidase [Bacillota bacterium]HQD19081.1 beta-galactosidase [Bacillota bacterium]